MPDTTRRAPQPVDEPAQRSTTTNTSGNGGRTNERRPFLKAEHLHANKITRALIERPIRLVTGGEFGNKMVIGVLLDTEQAFDFSFKIGGQQQIRLERQLGKDLTTWPDREIALQRANYEDRDYPEVVEKK